MPARTSAAPISIAHVGVVAARVHHADLAARCTRARTVDLNGRSSSSVTGSASMSARSATTGPGLPPRRTPTTPVFATPVRTSMPEGAQVVRDDSGCADLAVAQLRVLVEVAPPGDDLRHDSGRGTIDAIEQRVACCRLGRGGRRKARQQGNAECKMQNAK